MPQSITGSSASPGDRHLLILLVLLGCCLLLVACHSQPAAAPSPAPPLPQDPLRTEFAADLEALPQASRYEVELTIDPETAHVAGAVQIEYTNTEQIALSDLYLRLFPNTPGYGGQMDVTDLYVDGQPVTPVAELEGSALRVPLRPALEPGRMLTLSMNFTVTIPTDDSAGYAQFALLDGIVALPDAVPLVPVYDDEGWNVEIAPDYGDAVYSDISSYTVQIVAPPGWTLIASGTCSERQPGTWNCSAPLMRDMAAVLGQEYERAGQVVDGVLINSYHYPGDAPGGGDVLLIAADAVRVFSELFGPYPYTELDLVETPTLAGGIEYPGLVVLSDRLYGGGNRLEWLVAHEVSHQWWYGLVGSDQVDDPWLDEALAQYSTLLYFEQVYDPLTADAVVRQFFTDAHQELIETGGDLPVGLPVASYPRSLYSPVVYQKGPLYFDALREEVGDDAFFAILQAYYRDHRYGIATPESFLAVVEAVSGDRHAALFEEWITGSGP
jgi:hypothetical protein